MELENIFLESCSYKDIPSNSLVLNSDELPYYLLVHLPDGIALDYRLYQLDEIGVHSKEIPFTGFVHSCCGRPWYKITSAILNKTPGQHIYRMSLTNPSTEDIIYLYFSYILQTNNPDKPYYYMDSSDCCCSSRGD